MFNILAGSSGVAECCDTPETCTCLGMYYSNTPIDDIPNIVAYYPLTGTAEDVIGNYDGTEVGVTYVDDAERGAVMSNSTSQYLSLPNIGDWFENRTEFTFSAWGKPSASVEGVGYFFCVSHSSHASPYYKFTVNYSTNGISTRATAYTSPYIQDTSATSDIWRLITVTFKDGSLSLFVDGVHKGTEQCTYSNIGATHSTAMFGRIPALNSTSNAAAVTASNVRLYDRALLPQEITDIYEYEKNLRPILVDDGLVAYYPLENNSMDNWYNQYDGTDTGVVYDGTSCSFTSSDGSDNILIRGAFTSSNPTYTASVWVKCADSTIRTDVYKIGVVTDIGDSNKIYLNRNNSNSIYIGYFGAGSDLIDYPVPDTTQWMHIVMTCDGYNRKVYLDETLIHTNTGTNSFVDDDIVLYGTNNNTTNIANHRFYNRVITEDEISLIYNTEKTKFGL